MLRKVLQKLQKLFDTRIKTISDSGKLITVPGASYDLFSSNVYSYFGFVDLTDLHHGDEVEIFEYIKPWSQSEYILHKSQKFSGPVSSPLVSFTFKIVDCPVKIVLRQNSGIRRDILYSFKFL